MSIISDVAEPTGHGTNGMARPQGTDCRGVPVGYAH